jgi:hypothetical protein
MDPANPTRAGGDRLAAAPAAPATAAREGGASPDEARTPADPRSEGPRSPLSDSEPIVIPEDIAAAMAELDRMLPADMREKIRRAKVEDMVEFHMSLGMWMRNNWELWGGGSPLASYFNGLGLHHPDDMSGVILDSYWRHLHGQPLAIDQQVAKYRQYWSEMEPPPAAACPGSGRDAKVTMWLHDRRPDGAAAIKHVADCGHGRYFVYERSAGWYEPDDALQRRIADGANPSDFSVD